MDRIIISWMITTPPGNCDFVEGSDFVQFTLDGVNVVVNKNYIEPVSTWNIVNK